MLIDAVDNLGSLEALTSGELGATSMSLPLDLIPLRGLVWVTKWDLKWKLFIDKSHKNERNQKWNLMAGILKLANDKAIIEWVHSKADMRSFALHDVVKVEQNCYALLCLRYILAYFLQIWWNMIAMCR